MSTTIRPIYNYVLAQSREQFLRWCKAVGKAPESCRLVERAEDCIAVDWSNPLRELVLLPEYEVTLLKRDIPTREQIVRMIASYCQARRVHGVRVTHFE